MMVGRLIAPPELVALYNTYPRRPQDCVPDPGESHSYSQTRTIAYAKASFPPFAQTEKQSNEVVGLAFGSIPIVAYHLVCSCPHAHTHQTP